MRGARIKEEGPGYYHIISRVVDRRRVFDDNEKERFCGYGEAVAGSKQARRGLCHVMRTLGRKSTWDASSADYRKLLYMVGEQRGTTRTGAPLKPGFRPEKVEAVIGAGGSLSINELLRCRVRYFSDGAVLGSRAFVEDVFQRHRQHFGQKSE